MPSPRDPSATPVLQRRMLCTDFRHAASRRALVSACCALLALFALRPAAAAEAELLAGEFTYMADAARFVDCRTGRAYPVAMEGDFVALERAYRAAAPAPGAPLYVTFEGSIAARPKAEGEGAQPTAIVRRFVNVWPSEACARAKAPAALENTYWRLVQLKGEAVGAPAPGRREPRLQLRQQGGKGRFAASVGCNQLIGGYQRKGSEISFAPAASTMMACPPPLAELERRLTAALAETRSLRIAGNTLELQDAAGTPVALFEAVYL
jgi:copper homeostasis protein (lipoprotein)